MMPNTTESQGSPVLIPLLHNHSGNHDDDSSSAKLSEWAMIELNGELIAPPPSNFLQAATGKENPSVDTATTTTTTEVSFIRNDQLELGSVRFVDNNPVMILGTHELKGKVESLKRPFCILQKEESSQEDGGGTSYRVSGMVTRKLLFDKYPKVLLR